MGLIEPTHLELESGERVIIRSAQPEDAAEMLDHVRISLGESEYYLTLPEEFNYTLEQETELVRRASESPCELVLLVLAKDDIIASLMVLSETKIRLAHASTMHMGVREKWRGLGIGTALMRATLDWADSSSEIEKLCLSVFSTNTRAIRLYERMGFIEEGRRKKQYKIAPGEYANEVLMARFVE